MRMQPSLLVGLSLALSAACGQTNIPISPKEDGRLNFPPADGGAIVVVDQGQVQPDLGAPTADTGLPAADLVKPDGTPAACSDKAADGTHLNPGCDNDVQQTGFTGLAGISATAGVVNWLAANGKKWWVFGQATDNTFSFDSAGNDISSFFRTLLPGCATTAGDGLALNPGCDPDVQQNGITAIGSVEQANGSAGWLVLSGRKWWNYVRDATGKGSFESGGSDFAAFLRGLQPGCDVLTGDGLPMNPGCDEDVKRGGTTTLSATHFDGATGWILTAGTKWWSLSIPKAGDPKPAAFVDGGKDWAAFLRGLDPPCVAGGASLNPGCDPTVQSSGLTALGGAASNGKTLYLAMSGARFWLWVNPDPATGAGASFTAAGDSIARVFVP